MMWASLKLTRLTAKYEREARDVKGGKIKTNSNFI